MDVNVPLRMRRFGFFFAIARFTFWAAPVLGQSYIATRIAAWVCAQAWLLVRAEIKVNGRWHRVHVPAPDFEVTQC